jgi:hypothetical protein
MQQMITWSKHKEECRYAACCRATRRGAHDEALFQDPPAKEDCPICFLPMPTNFFSCASLPDATRTSLPIYNLAIASKELGCQPKYYPRCGKSICIGCIRSIVKSENDYKCPFCNSDRVGKTDEEMVEEMRMQVEANDPVLICLLANSYHHGS